MIFTGAHFQSIASKHINETTVPLIYIFPFTSLQHHPTFDVRTHLCLEAVDSTGCQETRAVEELLGSTDNIQRTAAM